MARKFLSIAIVCFIVLMSMPSALALHHTFTKLSNPATLPANNGINTEYSPNGNYLAVVHATSPFLTVYSISGTTYTKLADPATLPGGTATAVCWSADSTKLAVNMAGATSPNVRFYSVSGSSITLITQPAQALNGDAAGSCSFYGSDRVVMGTITTPFITVYDWDGDNYERTSITIGTPPTSTVNGIDWSTDGVLALAHTGSPYVSIYTVSGTTFTKLTNPASLPASDGNGANWNPTGDYLAISHNSNPIVTVYYRSGTTYTKLADPATLPTGDSSDGCWSPGGTILAIAHGTTPFVTIYEKTGTGASAILTKYTNPSTLPASTGTDCSWKNDGSHLAVAHVTTPFITIYEVSPSAGITNFPLYLQINYCQAPVSPTCTSPGSWVANDTIVNASAPGTDFFQNGTTSLGWFNLSYNGTTGFNNTHVNLRISNNNSTITTVTYNLSHFHTTFNYDTWSLYVTNSSLSVTVAPNPGSFVVPEPALFYINKTTEEIVYWAIFKVENTGSVTLRTSLYPIEDVTAIARYPQSGPTVGTVGLSNHTGQYFIAIANATGGSLINVPFVICSTSTTCQSQPTQNSAINTTIQTIWLSNIQTVIQETQAANEEVSKGLILTAADWAYGSFFSGCDCVLEIPNMYYVLILVSVATIFIYARRRVY